jgi:hypothetical protein
MVSGKRGKRGRPKGTPNKWAKLYGSKRKIRELLTGEKLPPPAPGEPLANDLLDGATEISAFTGKPASWVYHNRDKLGLRTLGETADAA